MRMVFAIMVLYVLQISLIPSLFAHIGTPDLMLTLVIFSSLFIDKSSSSMRTCWLIGLVKDLGSTGSFGAFALLYLCIHVVVFSMKDFLYRENILFQMSTTCIATFCCHLVYGTGVALFVNLSTFQILFTHALMIALMTSICVSPICFILRYTLLSEHRGSSFRPLAEWWIRV